MKRLFILICIWLNVTTIYAQHETGLADDDPGYNTTGLVLLPNTSKADLPRSMSLKPYCPMAGNQGKIASCVGWAVGYGLMTIEKAIQNNETDTRAITENAFSPLFVYNQVKSDEGNCKSASVMSAALEFLQTKGNCLAKEFNINPDDCYSKPDDKLKMRAKGNTIADFNRLFDASADEQLKIDVIRRVLAQNKPVSIGLKINNNFMTLHETDYWNPSLGKEPDLTHAMVVVGYDDDAACFTLFNSWGRGWGRDGFIKVKYRDMGEYCRFAFVIHLSKNSNFSDPLVMTESGIERPAKRQSLVAQPPVANQAQPNGRGTSQTPTTNTNVANQTQPNKKVINQEPRPNNPTPSVPKNESIATQSPSELVEMSGSLEVNYFTGRWTDNSEPIFESLGVESRELGSNHYNVSKKDWRVGDQFQLALTSKISGAYIYIVSINPRNEVKIMFPRNEEFGKQYAGLFESPLMMLDGARAVLPNPKRVMKIDYAGTDRICILFSIRKIKSFPLFCQKIQKWNGDFDEYLHKLLGNVMIPTTDTDFSLNKAYFSVSTRSEGSIVPIIIEFKSQ